MPQVIRIAQSRREGEEEDHKPHHNGDEWIGEFLVVHLRVDIDAREPTAIPRMRVVPSDRILQPSYLQVHGMN